MHYTSIENIHKVIDPLLLDELNEEFDKICVLSVEKTKENKLIDLIKIPWSKFVESLGISVSHFPKSTWQAQRYPLWSLL
jgi:hypothetical protein